MHSYWNKQTNKKPLFPDIEWNKPERKNLAGKMGIIGGSKMGFAAVANSYETANRLGVGEVRALMPDTLRKNLPPQMTDALFGPSTKSGELSSESAQELASLADWADVLLFSGDAGKNSQTAILYENFLKNQERPTVIARDAVDLVQNSFPTLLENSSLIFVTSFAQLQKIFRAVYYPKILTFSMQLAQLVENVHKFTTTYPVTIVTFHADQLIISKSGEVVTHPWTNPLRIWNGEVAARIASYVVWSPTKILESASASLVEDR